MRIAVTDVGYSDGPPVEALAVAVVADAWTAAVPIETRVVTCTGILDYEPGAFWKRELPCLEAVLQGLGATIVVVDGYVWLDDAGRKGLGAHLHDAIGVPVVGIAKTAFAGSAHARSVLRGSSHVPLYVTAVGIPVDDAVAAVVSMHGAHRRPELCALADRLSRGP